MSDENIHWIERVDPVIPNCHPVVISWHLQRYQVALMSMVTGITLDAGCGVGYGARALALARPESQVIGIDLDEEAIALAKSRYDEPNLTFLVEDVETFSLPYEFNNVVMLEVVEHLSDPENGLANVARHLVSGGRLLISIPLGEYIGLNPYHKTLWGIDEFIEFVKKAGFKKRTSEFRQPANWTGLFERE